MIQLIEVSHHHHHHHHHHHLKKSNFTKQFDKQLMNFPYNFDKQLMNFPYNFSYFANKYDNKKPNKCFILSL